MKNQKRTLPLANLIFAGSLVVIILLFPSLFSKLDAWIHDVWLDLRFTINRPVSQVSFLKSLAPHRPPSDEITIVLVDDRSMLGIPGLYAGDKQFYADVLNKLQKHNPKLIALDLFFATDSLINPKGDLALAKAVQECDNLVIKAYRRDDKRITPPFAKVAITGKAAPSYFKNYRGEAIRSVSMAFINEKNELQPSFQSEMWRIYNGLNPGQLKFREQNLYYQLSKGIQNVPLVDREYMLLNYDVQVKNFRTISFFDVYKGNYPKEIFENKAIIVGEAHSMLHESFYTPLGYTTHSPYLNALALRNLINNNFLKQPDEVVAQTIPIVILAIFIFFVFNFLNPVASLLLTIITCLLLAISSFLMLTIYSQIFDVSASVISVASSLIFVIGRKYYLELSEKLRIKNAFQHYVTASVVNEILKNPEKLNLHGEERELTIFFSDIEGFTTMAEGMSPLEVVSLLNEYLTEMTDIIFKYDGLLDKYEGDAIMAIFGAPIDQRDHAIRSCKCALENQKALAKLRERWKAENKPMLRARIGINTGLVVVGNMGSKMRFDYTVIGDNVNLAARLETANKIFNTEILVSETTANLASEKIISRCVACLKAAGKTNLINVYEVLADVDDPDKEFIKKAIQAKESYENALLKVADRDFEGAESVLAEYLKNNPDDKPANALYSKTKSYKVVPPPVGLETVITQDLK